MRTQLPETYDMVLAFNRAVSPGQVEALTRSYAARYGVEHLLAGVLPTRIGRPDVLKNLVLMGHWPTAWSERYFGKLHIIRDPTIRYALRHDDALYWGDLTAGPLERRSLEVMQEASEFGLRQGLTFPQATIEGSRIGISFAGNHIDGSPQARVTLAIISSLAINRILQIQTANAGVMAKLTERERECLSWFAEGKTTADVADILSVSVKTIEKNLYNARKKLGALNSTQAVAISLRLGLIR